MTQAELHEFATANGLSTVPQCHELRPGPERMYVIHMQDCPVSCARWLMERFREDGIMAVVITGAGSLDVLESGPAN